MPYCITCVLQKYRVEYLVSSSQECKEDSVPIRQGSYSPFEKTMFDAVEKSKPPKDMTGQSPDPLTLNCFMQSALICSSSYSPAPPCNTCHLEFTMSKHMPRKFTTAHCNITLSHGTRQMDIKATKSEQY